MTPEQDRAALESTPRPAGSERDRRVHGLATAGFGAIVGAYVGITQALPRDNGAVSLITAGYVGLLIALAFWQKRAARTVPRHANLIGYVGLAGTLCLAFVGVVGLNILENVTGERATVAPLWYLLAAVAIAAPMLIAGGLACPHDTFSPIVSFRSARRRLPVEIEIAGRRRPQDSPHGRFP